MWIPSFSIRFPLIGIARSIYILFLPFNIATSTPVPIAMTAQSINNQNKVESITSKGKRECESSLF